MKILGFNTLRKHIKIEPANFYEACDRLGMIVFQDFVNNSDYSFLHDTVLPTIFPRLCDKGFFKDKNYHKNPEGRRIFKETAAATISCLYNFPCICYYTQLSDVEDETNGFLTYDRVAKIERPIRGCEL